MDDEYVSTLACSCLPFLQCADPGIGRPSPIRGGGPPGAHDHAAMHRSLKSGSAVLHPCSLCATQQCYPASLAITCPATVTR